MLLTINYFVLPLNGRKMQCNIKCLMRRWWHHAECYVRCRSSLSVTLINPL